MLAFVCSVVVVLGAWMLSAYRCFEVAMVIGATVVIFVILAAAI